MRLFLAIGVALSGEAQNGKDLVLLVDTGGADLDLIWS